MASFAIAIVRTFPLFWVTVSEAPFSYAVMVPRTVR